MRKRMNIKVNDCATRVPYPIKKKGFIQTYAHVLPGMNYRVIAVDEERGAITLRVFYDSEYRKETFWAGNFYKATVTLTPILPKGQTCQMST